MSRSQHIFRQQALLLSAVALLFLAADPQALAQAPPAGNTATAAAAAPTPAANNTVGLNEEVPAAANGAAATPSANGTDNGTLLNMSNVDQPVPPFSGIRSCLPFNILLAAPQENGTAAGRTAPPSGGSSGRILIQAEYAVINQTVAAMEDDVLSLSLAGGFESRHPINFTIVMPAASQLRYVANYGSGAVVLGPGHSTPSLRLSAPTVGPIQAFNLTADSLYLSSKGVLGSSVSGAFNQAEIVTGVATGSVAFASATPANLTVRLGGITTVVADVPQGSIITGTAGGLSKVQYTAGSCYVSSEISVPFPAPSIFGPGGFGFAAGNAQQQGESKCQLVQPGQVEPVVATASNPQWTCGVIVDGRLSCQQGANATDQALQWDIQNTTTPQPAPTAHVVASPPNIGTLDNATATSPNPATNAAATATPAAIATTAGNGASGIGAETASPSPGSPANADTAAANSTSAGSSTSNIREQAAVDNAANAAGAGNGGGATTVTALAPPAPVDSPVTNVAGASPSPAPKHLPAPPGSPGSGAGRKMLQDIPEIGTLGLPSAFQGVPLATTTTTNPQGTISTGSYTSGPGASSFSSGSVGDTMQTTSSQGGSAPTTTLSTGGVGSDLFNPVVVPATPPEAFAADNASSATPPSPSTTQTAGAAAVNGTAAPPSPLARAAAGAAGAGAPTSLPDSERIHAAGPSGASGVAVVNTVCSSRQQSLSMLVQPAAEPQRASRSFPLRPGGTGGAAAAPGAGGAGVAGGGGGSGLEGSAGNAAPASP